MLQALLSRFKLKNQKADIDTSNTSGPKKQPTVKQKLIAREMPKPPKQIEKRDTNKLLAGKDQMPGVIDPRTEIKLDNDDFGKY